jgi:hypothetical protein
MVRSTLIILAVLATAATAIANVQTRPAQIIHTSVVYKNLLFPIVKPLIFEKCAVEDCSDTPANS